MTMIDTKRSTSGDAMWDFRSIREDAPEASGSDNDDIQDDLSAMSMTSVEKYSMAQVREDITFENSLSAELMKLSINDRTAIEEDVHGVSSTIEETPEFLAWRLQEFDKELIRLKDCPRRRRKLERSRRLRKNRNEGKPGKEDEEDVLRNVVRRKSNYVDEEECTASTMDTGVPTNATMDSSSSSSPGLRRGSGDDHKSTCYVNDPKIRLRFIRAEGYDSKKAAIRFVKFLEFAQELYGNFVADRPIRLSDLKTKQEKRALTKISFQFLPFRDRSGRRVYVSVGSCGYDVEPKMRIKILWYMFWVASEDIESQRKGVVIIGWPNDSAVVDDEVKSCESDSGEDFSNSAWENSLRPSLRVIEGSYQGKAMEGLPMRVAAFHICFTDRPIFRIVNTLFYFSLSTEMRLRYKVHIGEPLEIRYKLQGFGIPVDLLPLTHTLKLKPQNHLQWIAFRKMIEQHEGGPLGGKKKVDVDPKDLVECPRSYDVIIGKAKYTNNPGNVFYRSLIEATHDEHLSRSKRDKVELTWSIVRKMEERNGRFLELNKTLKAWVHIRDRHVMRQKVAQSYKEYKRNVAVIRNKRQLQLQDTTAPISELKRQRTDMPTILEKDNSALKAFLSGFNCDDNDGFVVSRSIFTAM